MEIRFLLGIAANEEGGWFGLFLPLTHWPSHPLLSQALAKVIMREKQRGISGKWENAH